MRILFLTQVLPYPLDAGPKVRAYYVLRYLAEHHEVTLVSFTRASDTSEAIAHLRDICEDVYTMDMPRSAALDSWHLLRSLIIDKPFLIARDRVNAMHKLLRHVVNVKGTFDAVHADQLWMAPYALWVKETLEGATQAVLDQHNAVHLIPDRMAKGERNPAKRALLALEGCKMVGYESKICHEFGDVIWVTEEDYNAVALHSLKEHLPCSAIIPICGDPEDSMPVERSAAAKRVTFLGGLHYPPNAQGICWYAEHAFPRVLEAVPDAILTVIGKQPPAELHTFGIPEQNLEVTGFVADPLLYLEETAVFVVPLLAGGGMRVKILDAWVWQMPVVSTTVGAEGIKRRNGENILIADEPEALAESTIFLLQNPSEADRIAHAGRRWVNEYYNWRKLYQDWDSIYKSIPEKVVR